ncbi:hypothetical protein [Megalodesulfovibrio gigas]|uniref:hypothetical protein n=1 Tax=Megalodesulfovibrio gigas TaxID=879 RepID=UPI000426987D|nr:hypothetical protein [Megalodesulfovibrio gigas]
MPRHDPTDHFIQEKAEVRDADRTASFAAPAGERLTPTPFDPEAQSLLLLGLPGSGCGALATALADELDMMLALLGLETGHEQPEQALAQAMRAMQGVGRIFVLDDRLAAMLDGQALSFLPVVPVYLIADVGRCLAGLGETGEDSESLRQSLAARQDALEPKAMALARHIIRAELTPAEQCAQLMEKLLLKPMADDLDEEF